MASIPALCATRIGSFPALSSSYLVVDFNLKPPVLITNPHQRDKFHSSLYLGSSTVKLKRTFSCKNELHLTDDSTETKGQLVASQLVELTEPSNDYQGTEPLAHTRRVERRTKKRSEQLTYLFVAVASTTLITSLAAGSVYYRFVWQMQGTGEVSFVEMFCTFSLAIGAAVGMEFWARWAHRSLWHTSLWHMHESHHRPREGPFELNDAFAIINAAPAIALMLYGFLNTGLLAGLCYGAGLGITIFGIAYMFVHDGLVHRRFPVGPIADVPYFQKVAAAHKLHHADLFDGVPYGLFLGPKELQKVGGLEQLEEIMKRKSKAESAAITH